MKKLTMSERGAQIVKYLRNENGALESEKVQIADSICGLVDMMHSGIDVDDITPYTNDLMKAMSVISSYNSLLNRLSEISDSQLPMLEVVKK